MAREIDIRAENIGMEFKRGSERVVALESLSFEVKRGEFFCIVGPSGCGKTTLLRIFLGLQKPTSGSIDIDPERLKGGVAYIPQSSALLPWRTLLQNASLGLEIKSSINKVRNETIKHLLEQYGLAGFEQHLPNELSGGMRRRVDLVRALASEPQILFCDEPFSAIDFVTRLELNTLFKLKCKEIGVTTVVVTHNIEEAIFLGDRVAVMSNRPSRIISTHETILSVAPDDAVKSRKSPEFDELFGKIWKNLEGCYEEEH